MTSISGVTFEDAWGDRIEGHVFGVPVAGLILVAACVMAAYSFVRFGPRDGWQHLRRIGAKRFQIKSPTAERTTAEHTTAEHILGLTGAAWGFMLVLAAMEHVAWFVWGSK